MGFDPVADRGMNILPRLPLACVPIYYATK